MEEKTVRLGLVSGNHTAPMSVDGFVLEEAPDANHMPAIHKAVQKSLEEKLGKHANAKLELVVDGTEFSAVMTMCLELEVVVFCTENGVRLTIHQRDIETGKYISYSLL